MSFRPCCVIPSRNHHLAVAGVLAAARSHGLPVFLVDDASEEPACSALAALHAPDRGVTVARLERRGGKGGAVEHGFRLAVVAGFSHAVQLDADCQHDLGRLPALLALARKHPAALVAGEARYDASVPPARRWGRWLTHVWVWVETLSLRITDSMCGFRCYPLGPSLALLTSRRLGRFMDFDTEIMVRLFWRGVPVVMLPVAVMYPEGNTSNFDMLRDNWRITKMHTRLALGMLPRMPLLLWRKLRP
jgi:GT2 family glycosyltransferase